MTTPDFNNLTPPDDLAKAWDKTHSGYARAARWGAAKGYQMAVKELEEFLEEGNNKP